MNRTVFHYVVQQEKQVFLESRAISSMVKIGDDNWDMQETVRAFTDGLHRLVDLLIQQS